MAAVLTLCVGNVAVCAGWQATAEARMACCTNGTTCPMHKSESRGSAATRGITQAQADSCCATASASAQSSVATPNYVLSNVTAVPATPRFDAPAPVFDRQQWRILAALPPSPVPRHLLLSVLLV
jgi:hypothetical protein